MSAHSYTFTLSIKQPFYICDALHDLVSFVQFKNVKNTHGVVLSSVIQLCLHIHIHLL